MIVKKFNFKKLVANIKLAGFRAALLSKLSLAQYAL